MHLLRRKKHQQMPQHPSDMANNPSSFKYHSRHHFSVRFGTNKLGLAAACGRWENRRAPSVTQYHIISFAHLSILRGHDLAEVSAPSNNTIALDKSGSGASAGVSSAGETSPTPAPTWFPPRSGLTRFEAFSCRSRGTGSMGLCFKPCDNSAVPLGQERAFLTLLSSTRACWVSLRTRTAPVLHNPCDYLIADVCNGASFMHDTFT